MRGAEGPQLGVAIGRCKFGQSPFWGAKVGPNPTDRGKPGTKKSILVEASGGPLSTVIAPANVHDTKLLEETLRDIVVERPKPTNQAPQHLCLDKGYDNPSGRQATEAYGYVPHIRKIGEEKLDEHKNKRLPARRWVVERTLGWFSKCRSILVRYEKNAENYLGLIQLDCALLWFRRLLRFSVLR